MTPVPPAKPRLALFDLDHTLLTIDSDEAWVEFLIERGVLDGAVFEQANAALVERYMRGHAQAREFAEFYLSTLVPHSPETLASWHAEYLARRILPALPDAARALVDRHRAAGDLLVLTTATSRFLTARIADEIGFEHLIATEPEMRDGRYTGRVAGVANMREGKVTRLDAWLAARGSTLGEYDSTFYSDSRNDIPLLLRVDHPVAVNPDAALAELARERGWPVITIR
jgi:HAD superfamily hydrolase (TIGR01490 family)